MKNSQINITFEEDQEHIIEVWSHREDMVLSAIAEIRDMQSTKKVTHEDAWK